MVEIYALCVGQLAMDQSSFFADTAAGTQWTIPVSSYLIVHPQGRALFDTGVHCQAITDPVGRLGEERARRIGIRSQTGEDVVSQLGKLGLGPDDITYVMNSHFHFDHCGGNEFFPHSTILVQNNEMTAARQSLLAPQPGYSPNPQDFHHALNYQMVDGEYDVFGDGKVVLIPTYGHTPGHQSLLVRPGKGADMVFTADACYTKANMDRDVLPRVLWDAVEMSHSLARLRDLRDKQGMSLYYGHDPAQWHSMRCAPEALF